MAQVEHSGWLVLEVADAGREPAAAAAGRRRWRLVPETDTALYPGQAGHLPLRPSALLTYVEHLRAAFARRGVPHISVRAVASCVSTNGYAAPPHMVHSHTAHLPLGALLI